MADAILWQLLEACQLKLRQEVSFQSQGNDSVDSIDDEDIVIRKVSVRDEWNDNPNLPAVIISVPHTVSSNSASGENNRDDVTYPVLFQIVNSDYGDRVSRFRTYLKWQEQIAKCFRNQPLADPCEVWGTQSDSVDSVDEKLWVRHEQFVAGVEIRFHSLETRT